MASTNVFVIASKLRLPEVIDEVSVAAAELLAGDSGAVYFLMSPTMVTTACPPKRRAYGPPGNMAADYTFSFSTVAPSRRIFAIQDQG